MTARSVASSAGDSEGGVLDKLNAAKKDYKSCPTSDNSGGNYTGLPAICVCICIVELCERLAFYTFTGTQEFFLEKQGYSLAEAGGLNSAMSTLCMAWALVAGWVADCVLGRFHTILCFGVFYAAGSMVASFAAFPSINQCWLYLFGVMVLVPLGTAGIKANISNFGADQYDTSTPQGRQGQETFFSWFYLNINIGSAIAYGCLTTLGSNGGLGIPKAYGYFAVYTIAAAAMIAALALFVSGKPHYRMQAVQRNSALGGVAQYTLAEARELKPPAISMCVGCILLVQTVVLSVTQAIMPRAGFDRTLQGAAFVSAFVGLLATTVPCLAPGNWMGDRQIPGQSLSASEVKGFLKLLPVLVTGNLAFSALYNCMQFWFQQQACQMDLRVSNGDAQFSGSFFMIADCLGIVIFTPIALAVVNPTLDRLLPGTAAKYGIGMFFGTCSVLMAAILEMSRKSAAVLDIPSNCAPEGVQMSDMNAAYMVGPFLLMGIGEIYTQPVLMHFAYSESPPPARTLAAVSALVIGSVSNALFTIQIAMLEQFVPNDLNQGNLEYGYYCSMVFAATLYCIFLAVMYVVRGGGSA